jgi:hypothetical protein
VGGIVADAGVNTTSAAFQVVASGSQVQLQARGPFAARSFDCSFLLTQNLRR